MNAAKIGVCILSHENDTITLAIVRSLQLAGGYDVHVLTSDPRPPLRFSMHCSCSVVPLGSVEEIVEAVRGVARHHDDTIVIPVQETIIVLAGQARDLIDEVATLAPIPAPELCHRVDHKWECHQLMVAGGVPVSRTLPATEEPERLLRAMRDWPHGALIKPCMGYGGRGIERFDEPEQVVEALARRELDAMPDLIVQEFVPGEDLDCSLLSLDGRVIAHATQRGTLRLRGAYSASIGLEFLEDEDATHIAETFARVTKWNGVAHIDMRRSHDTGELQMVEVNPRYWQTLLGSIAVGVNFPAAHCELAMGREPCSQRVTPGVWTDFHAVTQSTTAVRAAAGGGVGVLRAIDFRTLARDPLVELFLLGKKSVAIVRRAVRRRLDRVRRANGEHSTRPA